MYVAVPEHPGDVRPHRRHAIRAIGRGWVGYAGLAGFIVLFGSIACWFGPACDYDVRNYHLYNAHALLADRWALDLLPAQIQTFHAPALDTLIEILRLALNDRPDWFLFLLAVPYAGCAWLAWRMQIAIISNPIETAAPVTGRSLAESPVPRQVLALCGTLAAATGAAALPTLAGPISEAPVDACILLACLLCWNGPSDRQLATGGFCLGLAVGLKLTAAWVCAGVVLAWLLTDRAPGRLRRLAWLAAAGLAGAALTAGWWWWWQWRRTGNPLFPYFNAVFNSPWLPPMSLADRRFLPRSAWQAVFDPFWWALHPSRAASELAVRDPRLAVVEAVVLGLALCAAVPRLRRRLFDRRAAFVLIVCVVGYAGWAVQFGILRYLAVLEFLGGAVVMFALRGLGRRGLWVAAGVAPAILALLLAFTIYPDWGRASRRDVVADVRLPPLPAGALLVLLDSSPMAYVALAAPPDVALVGANNNLVHPGDDFPLARQVEARIRGHAGRLFGLEMPSESGPAPAAATLRFYGLHRLPGCTRVRSSLDRDGITLCELARDG
jgi:hypothetical protein